LALGEPKIAGGLHLLLPFAALIAVVLFFVLLAILWAVTSVLSGFKVPDERVLPTVLTVSVSLTALIGASLGAIYAFRKQILAEREGLRADQQVFSDRYVKAAELLAHERPQARLAGLYSLAILADDWDEGRAACAMAICSYVRVNSVQSVAEVGPGEQEVQRIAWKSIRSRLLEIEENQSWHDQELDFSGGNYRIVDLDGIHLKGAVVQFRDCIFEDGEIRLRGAVIDDGTLDFTGSVFRNTNIRLSGVQLKGDARILFDRTTAADSLFAFDGMWIQDDSELRFRHADVQDSRLDFDVLEGSVEYHPAHAHTIDGEIDFSYSKFERTRISMWRLTFTNRLVFESVETSDVEIDISGKILKKEGFGRLVYLNLNVRPAGPTTIRMGPGSLSNGDLRIVPGRGGVATLDVSIYDFKLLGGELLVSAFNSCWEKIQIDLTGEQVGRLRIHGRFPSSAQVDIDPLAEVYTSPGKKWDPGEEGAALPPWITRVPADDSND